MPENIHPLLKRQLKKYLPPASLGDKSDFIDAINETYLSNDDERKLLERSLDISSQELMQKSSQMRAVFEAFPDIFLRVSLEGKILEYKSASTNIASILPVQLTGQFIQDILVLQISPLIAGVIQKVKGKDELITFEHTATYQNQKIYLEARIKALLSDQAIIIIRDITERKIAEEQLAFNAMHDRLTLLPNRALLLERINSLILRRKRNPDYNFAVFFIDFDRFKLINDSLGHSVGDELLIQISKRLLKGLREVDTLARLGGDEFCVILDETNSEKDATIVAARFQQISSQPYFINNKEIFMTMSTGIVLSLNGEEKVAEDYIREADIAMYAAKKNGRAQNAVFTDAMKQHAIRAQDLEADLRKAIENHEFELHYQPIVDLTNKQVLRMEALVRWIHPTKGIIPPNDFISLAEETGLIFPLGEFVLRRACEECCRWQRDGFPHIGVAVNFSAVQFLHSNMHELIDKVLKETGLNPIYLEIEITESIVMKNIHHTINSLQLLRAMRIKVSVDDFGTGHSSLSSLSEFPIDSLKIDRKFIYNIPGNSQNSTLTLAMIGLAHNLGMKVVGEGIEDSKQLDFLLSNGCDEGQGYFFSKPKPVVEVFKLIQDGKMMKL